MLSDVLVTMGANVVEDPAPRLTAGGTVWTRLRLAATPRRYDKAHDAWIDGETVFLDAVCWRRLAEHVVDSLHKGDRVVVHGRLRRRAYEVEGQKRYAFEVEAESVAPDLSRGVATLRRVHRPEADLAAAPSDGANPTPGANPDDGANPAPGANPDAGANPAPGANPDAGANPEVEADPWATPVPAPAV